MSETWIDVKPADVRVGDEVKVDGIGERVDTGGAVDVYAGIWWVVRVWEWL